MVHSFRSSRPGKPRSIWLIVVNIPALDMIVVLVMNWLVNVRNFSRYLFDVSSYFSFGKSDGILFSNLFIE